MSLFDPPLDPGIAPYVHALLREGVETFESCEGGAGHAYERPTIRFHGHRDEGLRATAIALRLCLPVSSLRRTWDVIEGELTGPHWEIEFASAAPLAED